LEEKLEVAQSQLEILHLLEQENPEPDSFVEQKVRELRGSFRTVTEVGRYKNVAGAQLTAPLSFMKTTPNH
jgi:hypothetical protein